MFFENEKDILKDGSDISVSDDNSIAWNDLLDDGSSGVVSVNSKNKKNEDEINLSENLSDSVDDDDLLSIINETNTQVDESGNVTSTNSDLTDGFDLDSQLEGTDYDDTNNQADNFKIPEKKSKKKGGAPIVLIALLFGILIAGGAYYAFDYMNNQNVSGDNLERNQTVQDTMDNTTKDDIEERANSQDEAIPPEENQEAIPVVNEDDTDDLTADTEDILTEKKEVINIAPTGRSNPFLPIQKYMKVEIPETVMVYDKANIAKPPKEMIEENVAATKMLTISVSGIMYDDKKPSAIITFDNNDYFVQKGDKLDDYKVVDIGKNYVTVALGKNLYKANIGEEFKLTVAGNAVYISDNSGGRQYHSVNSQNTETSSTSMKMPNERYVSDKEIEINVK